MKKTAIVLFNLGGPDHLSSVRKFLFNLFNDPAIIRVPQPLRFMIAKLISSRRDKTAQAIYAQMGGKSPILENTQAQARALENTIGNGAKCFIAMRYWHPFTAGAVAAVKNFTPDEIILLPLYPQFSTTTTASSLKEWRKLARKAKLNVPTKIICCYPTESGFVAPLAEATHKAFHEAKKFGTPRILFSAHGLPEKIVKAGDPYQWQCERTAEALVKAIGVDALDWVLCYQSRVGPLEWIKPSTDAEIIRAGADKRPVVIVPIAFVSEHSETLVEIDIEYRHLAEKSGVSHYVYVPTVGINKGFIEGLAALVQKAQASDVEILSGGEALCPKSLSGCCRA